MMKLRIQVLLLALVFAVPALAGDDQAGLDYWNGIDQDAITTDSGLQYKILELGPSWLTVRKAQSQYRPTQA